MANIKKESSEKNKNGKNIVVRGRTFVGRVESAKRQKTVKVVWEWRQYVQKYERYVKKRSVVHAHVPDNLSIHEGDTVKIGETRPLSKTKHFIVIEKISDKEVKEDKNASN